MPKEDINCHMIIFFIFISCIAKDKLKEVNEEKGGRNQHLVWLKISFSIRRSHHSIKMKCNK